MFDDEKELYTIGTVSKLVEEHPETLRVWEKNNLLHPNREEYQRRYSNNDIRRIKFIKYLVDINGLNIAGIRHLIQMYPCWYKKTCNGGAKNSTNNPVNVAKPCWKSENTYCVIVIDKADMCNTCDILKNCNGCNCSK